MGIERNKPNKSCESDEKCAVMSVEQSSAEIKVGITSFRKVHRCMDSGAELVPGVIFDGWEELQGRIQKMRPLHQRGYFFNHQL